MTPGRRDILIGAAGMMLGGGAAHAQSMMDVGQGLLGLLPGKEAEAARLLAAILKLETQADQKQLKAARLAFKTDVDGGSTLPTTPGGVYAMALPRLIRVLDRAEGEDPGMTDEAGRLLAELNAAQREPPEALQDNPPPPSRATSFGVLKDEYSTFFASASLRSERSDLADWHKRVMIEYRPRYENVEKATGVPWYVVGSIHGLEASYNFRAHFHNGDFPLSARTRQVPAGRPIKWNAPYEWEASARDALTLLGFVGKNDWTLERTLYRLEAYNGFGYRRRGVPSPYLWSFSNHYESGKFVADGKFNPAARSQQCGAATKIKMLVDSGLVSFA